MSKIFKFCVLALACLFAGSSVFAEEATSSAGHESTVHKEASAEVKADHSEADHKKQDEKSKKSSKKHYKKSKKSSDSNKKADDTHAHDHHSDSADKAKAE